MTQAILQKLKAVSRLPGRSAVLALIAWCLLWPSRLIVTVVPIRKLSRLLGADRGLPFQSVDIDAAQHRRAVRMRRAMKIAARFSGVSDDCYPQALVAHALLRVMGVPHAVLFGLRRAQSDAAMDAHAWVMAGDVTVCGGGAIPHYTVVRCFSSD